MMAHWRCLLWGASGYQWNRNVGGGVYSVTMTRRNHYLAQLSHGAANRAVTRAHNKFQKLIDLSIPEALRRAGSMQDSEIFIEAIVIGSNNREAALARLKSHFYVKHVLDAYQQENCESKYRSDQIEKISLHQYEFKHSSIKSPFKRDSKPVAPRSLGTELVLMLETIRAAHAPTAAISAASSSI